MSAPFTRPAHARADRVVRRWTIAAYRAARWGARMRRRLLVLVVAAATVALGACAGPAPQADPLGAQALALTAVAVPLTVEPGPLAYTVATLNPRIAAAQSTVTGFDFSIEVGDGAGGVLRWQGSIVSSATGQDFAMTSNTTQGLLDVRSVGGTLYMNLGPATDGLFLPMDPHSPDNPIGGLSDIGQSLDPTQGVTGVTEAIVALAPVGLPEQLDGVTVQRWDVTFDTTKVPAGKFGDMTGVPPTLTFSYWLGPDDLPRKASAVEGGGTVEMTFGHYGAPGPIVAPGPDQLTDHLVDCGCGAVPDQV